MSEGKVRIFVLALLSVMVFAVVATIAMSSPHAQESTVGASTLDDILIAGGCGQPNPGVLPTPTSNPTPVPIAFYVTNFSSNTITSYPYGSNGNTPAAATISGPNTGLSGPQRMVLGSDGVLYVPNQSAGPSLTGSITAYTQTASGNQTPNLTITGIIPGDSNSGLSLPAGVALDSTNRIYVANQGNSTITVYPAGASGAITPLATISGSNTQLDQPTDLALDSRGNPYVVNPPNNSITIYPPVSSSGATNEFPLDIISGSSTGLDAPAAIAFDSLDNFYIVNCASDCGGGGLPSIEVFPALSNGNVPPMSTISGPSTGLSDPQAIYVDSLGNIYVANIGNASVTVYAAGSNGNVSPISTIVGPGTGLAGPSGITFVAPLPAPTPTGLPTPVPQPPLHANLCPINNFVSTLFAPDIFDPSTNGFLPGTPPGWDVSASMQFAPGLATATILTTGPNAGSILIAGGFNTYLPSTNGSGPNVTNATDIYNPVVNSFVLGPFMNVGRVAHTATVLTTGPNTGRVLIIGGATGTAGSWTPLASTEIYDPTGNSFYPAANTPSMVIAHAGHTANVIPFGANAGKILIAGGCCNSNGNTLNATDVYSPLSNTFAAGPNMLEFRGPPLDFLGDTGTQEWSSFTGHTATTITNGPFTGYIFIAGGANSNNIGGVASTEIFNPNNFTFFYGPDLFAPRVSHTATVIPSGPNAGKILLAGGFVLEDADNDGDLFDAADYATLNSTDIFDPVMDSVVPGPNMHQDRALQVAAAIPSGPAMGDILIAGGATAPGNDEDYIPLAETEIYISATNTFAFGPSMTNQRYDATIVQLPADPPPPPPLATPTPTNDPAGTPTPLATPTLTLVATPTPTLTATLTPTVTPTKTATATVTPTAVSARLTVSPSHSNFGIVASGGVSKPLKITVSNKSQAHHLPVYISGVSLSTGFSVSSNGCPMRPFYLGSGKSCTIKLACTPSASGAISGTLTLEDNAANAPQTVSLTCTGQ
ncbi:MAG TPA: hypothetical protein VMU16_15215 [Candidatus Binataceae bacterium]|nr:hypothetical protein [Candidatus Binataceae bacterium]